MKAEAIRKAAGINESPVDWTEWSDADRLQAYAEIAAQLAEMNSNLDAIANSLNYIANK